MKKLPWIITVLLLALLLASCGAVNGNGDGTENGDGGEAGAGNTENNGNTEGGNEENKPTKPLIWDYNTDVYLVSSIDKDERQAISDKFTSFTGGNYLLPYSEDKAKRDHEVVIGPSERPVAKEAYEYLDYLMENGTQYEDAVNYVIYVLDGSLAIAYSDEAAFEYAVEAFYENCFLEGDYYADNGPVCWDHYSLRVRAEQNREKMYDEGFAKLKGQLVAAGATNADAIIKELRNYYSLIKTEQLYWLSDLYDIETGGFYHCNSARDAVGYLPDLESTVQTFLMLDRGGMFTPVIGRVEGGNADLPDFIVEPLSQWIKTLQDPETGYFYHPQWASVGIARRGRDLDNAVTLFRITGAEAYYDDPSGRLKGTLGAPGPNAVRPASALTVRLDDSAIRAVSAIVPVASNLPAYLQSIEAWEKHLKGLNINAEHQSYYKGNELAAEWSLIKAAGPEYVECVINFLNSTQYADIGLWEYQNEQDYDPNDKVGYNGTNGLMKICVFYSSVGYAVPNAYNALKSVIKVGLYPNTDPRDESVCYVLNIWTCLSNMMSNIKKYDPDNFDEAQALLAENIPSLLASAYDLQHTHLLADGGFKYYERTIMNGITGCAKAHESDTDSTMVATTSTINNIYGTLEKVYGKLTSVPMWGPDDYYIFINELKEAETIQKK